MAKCLLKSVFVDGHIPHLLNDKYIIKPFVYRLTSYIFPLSYHVAFYTVVDYFSSIKYPNQYKPYL